MPNEGIDINSLIEKIRYFVIGYEDGWIEHSSELYEIYQHLYEVDKLFKELKNV